MRRAAHEALLGPGVVAQHYHKQTVEALLLVEGLLNSPESWRSVNWR